MRSRSWASLWSGATAACAFAPGYVALLAARLGIGVGQAGFGPAGSALLGATFPPNGGRPSWASSRWVRRSASSPARSSAAWWPPSGGGGPRSSSLPCPGWFSRSWRCACATIRTVPQRSRGRAAAATLLGARSALGAMLGWCAPARHRLHALYLAAHAPGARVRPATCPCRRPRVDWWCSPELSGRRRPGYVSDRLARRDVRWRMLVPAVAAVATTATLGTPSSRCRPAVPKWCSSSSGARRQPPRSARRPRWSSTSSRRACARPRSSIFALVQNLMGLAVGPVLTGALADQWGLTTALASVAGAGSGRRGRVLVGVPVLRPGPGAGRARTFAEHRRPIVR